ncbi:MAG TPA: DNA polymerase III subunit gamma/tau [Chthonomonadaceae bacterium]|nr:DNA polymerase III subunit gamma/tau [Chthonomonadaceae bacterium]
MSYIALYRKYRSQSFDELMGQEQVTVTLQNAIRSGRIAHAYLFYGARGCGKTSTARLLARALNCVAQDGPTPEPCGACRLCVAIRDGTCMDVIEMDAASETGIDDVREKIVENVQYAPTEARYKVYVIDEVHDLSAKAFDALLKTLEEPPPHVIFILATTEHHKVPITIRSRCAQYHFKRGTLQDLAKSIERVIEKEGCTAQPEAVQTIARSAEGSWRDALSLLEQVLAYSDGAITAELVHRAIGSVGAETLARVTETLAQGDWCATLAIAGELIDSGKDVRQLFTALSAHLRDLMLICAGAHQAAKQELGPERYAVLKAQAPLFDPATLLAMTSVLSAAEREIRFTNQHRWLLESTLLRLMPSNIAASAVQPTAPAASAPAPAAYRRETVASTPSVVPRLAAGQPVDAVDGSSAGDLAPTEPDEPTGRLQAARPSAPAAARPAALTERPHEAAAPPPAGSGSTREAEAAPGRFAQEVSLDVVKRSWQRIIKDLQKTSPSGATMLAKGEVVALEGKTVVVAFVDAFARDRIQTNTKGKEKVELVVNRALNAEGYKIRCMTADSPPAAPAEPLVAPGVAALLDSPAESEAADPQLMAAFDAVATADAVVVALEAGNGGDPTPGMVQGDAPAEGVEPERPAAAPDAPAAAARSAPTNGAGGNGANGAPAGGNADAVREASGPQDTGFLAEVQSVFGGSVVRTEPGA